jgi:acetoin utilization protein AcuB
MTTSVVTIPVNTDLINARRIMDQHGLKRLPVVDRGKLVGVITKQRLEKAIPRMAPPNDLLELSYNIYSTYRTPVSDIMQENVVTVPPDMPVEEAVSLAQSKRVGALIVVEEGKVVGIATTNDFFYRILNKVLGVGEPGARIKITGGGEGQQMEEVISCLNKAGLNITTVHLYQRPGVAKKDLVVHLDTEDVDTCVKVLKDKGYEVTLRKH